MNVMPFGKFKGRELSELPEFYLAWLLSLDTLRDPLKTAVQEEVTRRAAEAPPPPPKPPREQIRDAAKQIVSVGYRELAKRSHPDAGGNHADMVKLNIASKWLNENISRAL